VYHVCRFWIRPRYQQLLYLIYNGPHCQHHAARLQATHIIRPTYVSGPTNRYRPNGVMTVHITQAFKLTLRLLSAKHHYICKKKITRKKSHFSIAGIANNTQQAVRETATIWHRPLQVDLWPFDLENGVRVTCVWRGLPLCQF